MAANKFSDFLAQLQAQQDPMMSQMSDQTPMPEEQNQMLSQMGAQQRMPQGQPIPPPTPVMAPPTPQQTSTTMMRKTAGVNPADLLAYQSKLNDYNNQYKDQLGKLQGYMQDYRTTEQPTDYRPIAAFLGGLPQNKNTQLLEAANAMAPESKAKQQQNAIANQQTYVKDIGEMAKNSDYVKMLNGQMSAANAQARQAAMDQRNGFLQQRLDLGNDRFAQQVGSFIDKDPKIMQYVGQKNQIELDKHTLEASGGKVPVVLLNEVQNGVAFALGGAKSSGLGQQERVELKNLNTKLTEIKQKYGTGVQYIDDPELIQYLNTTLSRLGNAYDHNLYSRAKQVQNSRKDGLKHSPDALAVLDGKVESYKPINYQEPGGDVPDFNSMSDEEIQKAYKAKFGGG